MVNTSVSRRHLEPSTAVAVHHAMGLPTSCQNFDVTNACLGFVNGMELAAAMIDSGMTDYALIVNGEDSRPVQERTIELLNRPDTGARYVIHQVSKVHTQALCDRFGIDPARVPTTFPTRGNLGPASVPFTLAGEADTLMDGDRVLLMGIGS